MIIYGISLFNVLRAFLHYHCNQSRWSFSGCNSSLVKGMTIRLASFNSPINLLQPGIMPMTSSDSRLQGEKHAETMSRRALRTNMI